MENMLKKVGFERIQFSMKNNLFQKSIAMKFQLKFYYHTLIELVCKSDKNFTAHKYKMRWTGAKCAFVSHQHYST
jgi:hypothetical protein